MTAQELPKLDDDGNPVVSWVLIEYPGTLMTPTLTMRVPVYLELPPVRAAGSTAIVNKEIFISVQGQWVSLNPDGSLRA